MIYNNNKNKKTKKIQTDSIKLRGSHYHMIQSRLVLSRTSECGILSAVLRMAFEMPLPASIINHWEKRHFAVNATIMCRVAAANVVSGKCTLAPVEYST